MKIWFQNRRTKWKKQENISSAEAAEHKLNAEKHLFKSNKNKKHGEKATPAGTASALASPEQTEAISPESMETRENVGAATNCSKTINSGGGGSSSSNSGTFFSNNSSSSCHVTPICMPTSMSTSSCVPPRLTDSATSPCPIMTDADDDDENEEALNVVGDDPYSAVNGLQVSERPVNLVMPRVSENAPDSPLSDFQPACKIDGVSSKDRAGGADNEQYDVHVQVENSLRQPA